MKTRLQKLLTRIDELDIDYNFPLSCSLNDEQLKNIQQRLSKDSSVYNIMVYRKPSTIEELNDMMNYSISLGKSSGLAKMISIYGEKVGTEKSDENNAKKANTQESMVKKYGDKEGNIKWKNYCEKQAFSNTFEYKREKHGMSREEFDEFNSSRSSTLDNFIKRHGEKDGSMRWKEYCDRQAYTNTKEYLGERYEEINKKKAITLHNMIVLYGEELGT